MHRIVLVLFLVFGTITLSGCSFFADFVLINESERVLTVKYYLQKTESIPFLIVKGRLATIAQHEANYREYNAFPDERITISADSRSATVTLNPGEVLFLVSLDIRDISDEPVFKSSIRKLSIESEAGALTYEGDQIFRQFVPSHSGWFPSAPMLYTLTFK